MLRIEQMLFDGVPVLQDGDLVPDLAQPGLALTLKEADAQHYKV